MQNKYMHEYALQRLEKAADDLETAEICCDVTIHDKLSAPTRATQKYNI